jgi:hypothetical protein
VKQAIVSGIKDQLDLSLSIVDTNFVEELDKQDRLIETGKQLILARVGNFLQNVSEDFWSGLEMVRENSFYFSRAYTVLGRMDPTIFRSNFYGSSFFATETRPRF